MAKQNAILPWKRTYRTAARVTRRRVAVLLAAFSLLAGLLVGLPSSGMSIWTAHADDPQGSPDGGTGANDDGPDNDAQETSLAQQCYGTALERTDSASLRCPLCLTAGDDGPFFSEQDLRNYTPPPPKPHSRITKPIWKTYPLELKNWPTVPRTYAPDTVTYLTQHEVRYGDRTSPYVALTFDCEAGTDSTLQILDTLRQEDVQATFFILGRYAYMWPEITREIVREGHEIGNHSFFHPLFTAIPPISQTLEITYTEAAVARAAGQHVAMRYFRFPFAGRNYETRQHAAVWGYQSAFWDLDPRGWDPNHSDEYVVDYIHRTAHYGAIVIMHCHAWDDVRALPGILQAIRDKGLIPGTISDVLTEADQNVPGYQPP